MILFTYPTAVAVYLLVLSGVLGLVLGSGLHCLAWRMGHNEKWSGGRSHCVSCNHPLTALDLIPLFSWLFLRGKCRYCGKPIHWRYPLSEGVLALAFMALTARYGLTLDTAVYLILVSCLFCLSIVDFDTLEIPHRFLIIPAIVRLIHIFFTEPAISLLTAFIPALVMGGGLLVLSLIMDKVLKKESMGGGDIKLLAMLGLYFSLGECILLVIIACVVGILMARLLMNKDADAVFPFGPALSVAALITLLAGEPILSWYLSLF